MLRFQGEEYRAPSSLHTNRKVAQKDPIFPPKDNPNLSLHTTTQCKRNINISNTRTHNSNIFYIRQIYVLISSWRKGGIDVVFSLHTHRFGQKSTSIPAPNIH